MNLRQLAALAKLSPSAVSLALRGSSKISDATRVRVRDLARQHGYRPDARIVEMMSHLRKPHAVRQQACFAVISLYPTARPWESSRHLSLIYAGMNARAAELGYRLEPLWLREPGMTYQRFRAVLDARGIQGLISFGSPEIDDEFPHPLDHYAIVTLGLSIQTPLHRVTSHVFNDTVNALKEVHRRGYQRPGLVLGRYEEERGAHAHVSAYLGWCEHALGSGHALPVLRLDDVEERPLLDWLARQRPDVIVFIHRYDQLAAFQSLLRRRRLPRDVGVVVISHILEGTDFSGMQQNQPLMGAWAVELLAARIANRDFGIPSHPRIEMVESRWIEGRTLRPALESTVDPRRDGHA
jgi:LacI family transcriptional regulator